VLEEKVWASLMLGEKGKERTRGKEEGKRNAFYFFHYF